MAATAVVGESKIGNPFAAKPVLAAPKKAELGGVVSLFSEEEQQYHRYSAAVAATEPLRELRDARAKQALGNVKYGSLKLQKKNVCAADPQGTNEALQLACSTHVATVSKIIRSLGLTVSEFNNLSRRVSADPVLRDRVMKQAYLFRISADVNGDDSWMPELLPAPEPSKATPKRMELETEAPPSSSMPIPLPGEDAYSPQRVAPRKRPPVTLGTFAVASDKVERLRQQQMVALQNELETTQLPPNLCSPSLQPVLSTRVRNLCEAFPKEAQKVVEDLGMTIEEFNAMLERSRKDPIMRLRMRLAWNARKASGRSDE